MLNYESNESIQFITEQGSVDPVQWYSVILQERNKQQKRRNDFDSQWTSSLEDCSTYKQGLSIATSCTRNSLTAQSDSQPMAPKIEAHVLVYSLLFGVSTLGAVIVSKSYSRPQAELDAELRAKYPDLIKKSQDQKVHMQAFFDKVQCYISNFTIVNGRSSRSTYVLNCTDERSQQQHPRRRLLRYCYNV